MKNFKTFLHAVALAALLVLFPALASAQIQTLSIVSGNGQLVCTLCATVGSGGLFDPLVVQVKDAAGNPVVGAVVTWVASFPAGSSGTLGTTTSVTAADGTASNTFYMASPFGGFSPYLQATVVASIPTSSVQFTESTAGTDPTTGVSLIIATLVSPPVGTSFAGPAGTTDTTNTIKVNLFSSRGGFIPGVEVRLVQPAGQTSTVACATGTTTGTPSILTDAAGNATCNVFFGGRPGTGTFSIVVGGKYGTFGGSSPFTFTVTAGLPQIIMLTSGHGQQGNAGLFLPAPLVATVQDLGGNALPNVDVVWTVNPANGATLTNTRTTTDPNGRVSTNVILGSTPGQVQIKVAVVSNAAVSATFTATVAVSITGILKLSGDPQEAVASTAFANPLVVQVTNGAQPVPGVTVQFAVTSGSATVITPSVSTDSSGQARTTVQAGPTAGAVVIVASVSGFAQTVTFSLSVRPPGPTITFFSNGASGRQGDISPCSVASANGTGIAPGLQGAVVPDYPGPWPFQVANVTIRFHDNATNRDLDAPIYSVANINSQESVTFEVPCEITPGNQTATIRVGSGSATVNVQIQVVAPGMFQTEDPDRNRRAVVVKLDGSLVWRGNPARSGETLRMYITGAGPLTPAIGTNQVGIQAVSPSTGAVEDVASFTTNQVVVGVGNVGANVRFARYARGFVGVIEVEFDVPENSATNNASPLAIAVSVGGNLIFGAGSSVAILQ